MHGVLCEIIGGHVLVLYIEPVGILVFIVIAVVAHVEGARMRRRAAQRNKESFVMAGWG